MMLIRTGILHNPALDAGAGEAVRACLSDVQTESVRILVLHETAVGDSRNWIEDVLCRWCDEEELDLVLTIGGTMPAPGPSNRELMPICTAHVVERLLPGLAETMRAHAGEYTDLALLDGSLAGIRGRTLVLNLPEGAGPAVCFLQAVASLLAPVLSHLQEGQQPVRLADALDVELPADSADADPDPTPPPTPPQEHANRNAPKSSETAATPRSRLNPDEFAKFLQRRGRPRP